MRRAIVVVVTLTALGASSWTVGAPPAGACSCAEPQPPSIVFDGTATDVAPAQFGELWTFEVDEVVEGDVGDEAAAIIDAGMESSCGIGLEPQVGGQYRLAVLPPDDGGPFHVNLCTGSIEELAGAPADGGATSAGDDGDDGPSPGVLVVGGLAALTVVGLGAAALVSRRRAATGS